MYGTYLTMVEAMKLNLEELKMFPAFHEVNLRRGGQEPVLSRYLHDV